MQTRNRLDTRKRYVFFIIPILFCFIFQLIGFDGLYGQDAYEYLRYSQEMKNYFSGGTFPGPFYWPIWYSLSGTILSYIIGDIGFSLQFISALSLGILALYMYKILRILYPKNDNISFYYIFTFGILSPYLFRSGFLVMSDLYASLFVLLTVYQFIKAYTKMQSYAFVFVFAVCALLVRYPTVVITLPLMMLAFYFLVKQKDWKSLVVALVLSGIIFLPYLVFQWDNLLGGTMNYFSNTWSIANCFNTSHQTIDGILSYSYPNIIFVFFVFGHPGFLFCGILASFYTIVHYKRLTFILKTLLCCIICYVLFLAVIPFQNIRVLTLVFPLVVVFLFSGFYEITKLNVIHSFRNTLAYLCILVQITLCIYAFKTIFKRTFFEKNLVTKLHPYQGKKLYCFEYTNALKYRGLNFEYRSLFSNLYDDFKESDLVFFNPEGLIKQWEGKKPMNNWNRVNSQYHLHVLESFDGGWKLYQVTNNKEQDVLD